MNAPFGWEVKVCGEYDFSLKGTSLQWIRLLIKKYKFAVNTTFMWKVQVCSEYDFYVKGTSLKWIRLFFERYKFAVNTTFVKKGTIFHWMRLLVE